MSRSPSPGRRGRSRATLIPSFATADHPWSWPDVIRLDAGSPVLDRDSRLGRDVAASLRFRP